MQTHALLNHSAPHPDGRQVTVDAAILAPGRAALPRPGCSRRHFCCWRAAALTCALAGVLRAGVAAVGENGAAEGAQPAPQGLGQRHAAGCCRPGDGAGARRRGGDVERCRGEARCGAGSFWGEAMRAGNCVPHRQDEGAARALHYKER